MSAENKLQDSVELENNSTSKIIHLRNYSKKITIPVHNKKKIDIFNILENNIAERKLNRIKQIKICGSILVVATILICFSLV
jgi:hypothetical protein